MKVLPFYWKSTHLEILDQRLLPSRVQFIKCKTAEDVAKAIRKMAVRGAPAIGCVAAYGMALAVQPTAKFKPLKSRMGRLKKAASLLKAARPTAVNLAWAVDRVVNTVEGKKTSLFQVMTREAKKIEQEDLAANRAMGRFGARLFKMKKNVVLTHCNAGALATAGHGTALGIIRELWRQKKLKKVFVDETRPYLQGARLTAWELSQEKIPYELITDNMAAHVMKTEKVNGVIVGCDRVAANGDTANKIGTYNLAILARHHKIPFYVAMPFSTLDLKTKTGRDVPIEERSSDEVVKMGNVRIAPKGTKARHPAFDVTPVGLISGFVSERGVFKPRDLLKQVPRKGSSRPPRRAT